MMCWKSPLGFMAQIYTIFKEEPLCYVTHTLPHVTFCAKALKHALSARYLLHAVSLFLYKRSIKRHETKSIKQTIHVKNVKLTLLFPRFPQCCKRRNCHARKGIS